MRKALILSATLGGALVLGGCSGAEAVATFGAVVLGFFSVVKNDGAAPEIQPPPVEDGSVWPWIIGSVIGLVVLHHAGKVGKTDG